MAVDDDVESEIKEEENDSLNAQDEELSARVSIEEQHTPRASLLKPDYPQPAHDEESCDSLSIEEQHTPRANHSTVEDLQPIHYRQPAYTSFTQQQQPGQGGDINPQIHAQAPSYPAPHLQMYDTPAQYSPRHPQMYSTPCPYAPPSPWPPFAYYAAASGYAWAPPPTPFPPSNHPRGGESLACQTCGQSVTARTKRETRKNSRRPSSSSRREREGPTPTKKRNKRPGITKTRANPDLAREVKSDAFDSAPSSISDFEGSGIGL